MYSDCRVAWHNHPGIRAVRPGELLVPDARAKHAAMVHGWASRLSHHIQPDLRFDTFQAPTSEFLCTRLPHDEILSDLGISIALFGWYYYAMLSHSTFAVVRRTITLTTFLALLTFTVYLACLRSLSPPNTASWTQSGYVATTSTRSRQCQACTLATPFRSVAPCFILPRSSSAMMHRRRTNSRKAYSAKRST